MQKELQVKEYLSEEKYRGSVFYIFSMFICSFIIVTICSENSFLYPFNNEVDVSCFMTVARCMRKGMVLYRDVYEHKGLYLYYIHILANIIAPNSYLGIYVIQVVYAFTFTVLSYLTLRLITQSERMSFICALATTIMTYTSRGYQDGGFAEEYVIPAIALLIYLVVRYYKCIFPVKIPFLYLLLVGFIFAYIVWIKYTAAGVVGGIAVYIAYTEIKEKNYSQLIKYIFQMLIGFAVGSIPLIVYFAKNKAFYDLFNVYFYNLLFKYIGSIDEKFFTNFLGAFDNGERIVLATSGSFLFAIGIIVIIYILLKGKSNKLIEAVTSMFVGNILFLCLGILYYDAYQVLIIWPFVIFPLARVLNYFNELKILYINYVSNFVVNVIKNNFIKTSFTVEIIVIILWKMNVFSNPYYIILTVVYCVIIYNLGKWIERKIILRREIDQYAIKYFVPIIGIIVADLAALTYDREASAMGSAAIMIVIVFLCEDWQNNSDAMWKWMKVRVDMVSGIVSKISSNIVLTSFAVALLSFVFANNVSYMFWKLEDTPQYKVAKYIEDSGVENPIIYHYRTLDSGVYNLLGIYPQMKYYGCYNINIPEVDETYEKYVENGEADFIITASNASLYEGVFEEYDRVAVFKNYYCVSENIYSLYARKK